MVILHFLARGCGVSPPGLHLDLSLEQGRPYGLVQVNAWAGGVPEPTKPNVVEADGWRDPLHGALRTDAAEPLTP
ncbi:hypothetical protein [Nonomuraea sp. NPDC050691]|uniref:hypothetical protein n=1 Tax=Nonomuraea sp. NPDC050691 TaxID=3155661 RepID=UPI0033F98002